MPRYKTRTHAESSESEYESDDETCYSPVKTIGEGRYDQARLFQSKTESEKAVVVLNPVQTPGEMRQTRTKLSFFQTVYPGEQCHLFTLENDYRLVIPHIKDESYHTLTIDSLEFQKTLFCSAAKALKDCHDKNVIVLDLKTDNIYFDFRTERSYLIDGGLYVPTGTPIDASAFQKSDSKIIEQYKKEYSHIPPECWSVKPTPVVATPQMDIYTLGVLMSDLVAFQTPEILELINSCLEQNPINRPTLEELIGALVNAPPLSSPEEKVATGFVI